MPQWLTSAWKSPCLWLLALAMLGLGVLAPDLAGRGLLILGAAIALFVVTRLAFESPPWMVGIGVVLGAVILPVLALAGVDVVWNLFTDWRPPALISAGVGALLVAGAAWLYHRRWWRR